MKEAVYQATKDATGVVAEAIRENTPVHSGRLLAAWRTRVEASLTGAKGTVSNKVRYANFVEHGNHPYHPMRAQPMAAKGVALTTGTVNAIYDMAVRKAKDEIQSA